jgi:dipeptidyl aminopeptidase/acylaminoacyl peptidase
VPLIESITTFKILQRQRVPFRLVTFPDEGHWILKGENGRHHLQEGLGWLKSTWIRRRGSAGRSSVSKDVITS